MGVKVKVSGINILLEDLDQYAQDVQNEIAKEVKAWAENTVSDAKRDVPVKTGDLKGSIRWVVGTDKKSAIVKAGGINGVNYAPYVEFGTGAGVSEAWLQEFGLVQYASQFKGKGENTVNLPQRTFLYRNARIEFEKTFNRIKAILQATEK